MHLVPFARRCLFHVNVHKRALLHSATGHVCALGMDGGFAAEVDRSNRKFLRNKRQRMRDGEPRTALRLFAQQSTLAAEREAYAERVLGRCAYDAASVLVPSQSSRAILGRCFRRHAPRNLSELFILFARAHWTEAAGLIRSAAVGFVPEQHRRIL